MKNLKYSLSTILGGASLGSVGFFVSQVDSIGNPYIESLLRLIPAFLIILVIIYKKLDFRNLNRGRLLDIAIVALIGYSLMTITFTISVKVASISITYLLLYLGPVFSNILFIVSRKGVSRIILILSSILAVIGIGLMFLIDDYGPAIALLPGIITGICYAYYILRFKALTRETNAETLTFLITSFGIIFLLPSLFFGFNDLSSATTNDLIFIALAGCAIGIGYSLLNKGLEHIKATQGTILVLSEPLSSVIIDAVLIAFPPSRVLIGGLLILVSVILSSINRESS